MTGWLRRLRERIEWNFAASWGHKDVRLTLAAAESLRVPMPLASLLRDRLLALLASGGEALD